VKNIKLSEENSECTQEEQSAFILNNKIFIVGEINNYMSLEISKSMQNIEEHCFKTNKNIEVYINSPGGFLDSCISIISTLKNSEFEMTTDITGVAYSAGAFIALAGDYRKISKFGSIMLHTPSFIIGEKLEDSENYIQHTREHFDRFIKHLIKDTKLSFNTFKQRCNNKDWYLSPLEAKKIGIINDIY